MKKFLAGFWTYLWKERMGYRRPLPSVPDYEADRHAVLERLRKFERNVRWLDLNNELYLRSAKLRNGER